MRAERAEQRARWRAEGWYPAVSVGQAMAAAAVSAGDTRLVFATRDGRDVVDLATVHARACRVAAGLSAAGVRPGDAVVVQAPASVDSTVAVQALWLLGAVVVPVVAAYANHELRAILDRAGAATMLVPGEWRGTDYAARAADLGVDRVIVLDSGDRAAPAGALALAALEASEALEPVPAVDPGADACIIFTSGSTAEPKGVRHSHETLLAGMPLAYAGKLPPDTSLATFPAGHIASVLGLLRPLVLGGTTVVMDRWSASAAAALIEEHRITSTAGTPFYLATLLDEAERSGADISSLRRFLVGAASVPPALVERAEAAGIVTWRTYGSTEHPAISSGQPDDTVERRTRTDGHVSPGNEVRIVDEDGRELPIGDEGEILARGPKQFLGYSDPALDEEAFVGESWFRTGDVGFLDGDGYLTITDRKKDIIIRGGENISSKEVEDTLATHPGVSEVAVCASPDPLWGEQVCAFVIPRPGASPTLDDLRAHVIARGLSGQKAPERLELVDELPRTAAGKVKKAVLRDGLRAAAEACTESTEAASLG